MNQSQIHKLDDALTLFNPMLQMQPKPPIYEFNKLLTTLTKTKQYCTAISLFNQMANHHFPFSFVTLNIANNCFCRMGQSQLSFCFDAFCKVGNLEVARELFSGLSAEGLQPSVRTYTMMIRGLCNKGLMEEAMEWLVEMEKNGCPPNNCTFNVIVQGFLVKNQRHETVVLLSKMVERNFSPDASTMSMLVDLLAAHNPEMKKLLTGFTSYCQG